MSTVIESIYPLSPMQQGMLFHSLYAPESGIYFEQIILSLKGHLKVAAFEAAWQKVVDRYSVLRTFFLWENGQTPLQVVLKQVNLPWHNLDWRELSLSEQEQQLSELLQTQRRHGFRFDQAPLMRCTLIALGENSYQFIWSHHHILIDGWCLPIIFKDVLSLYEAELTGQTCNLSTPRPYRDYIAWLNSQDKEAANEFWRKTLHGFSTPTSLRVDKTLHDNQHQDSNYLEVELRLSAEVSRNLQSVAHQHHVTLSTIVQAAWALLLSHYSGEKDVIFGVTVSGRTCGLSGVENMVGLLINTLPLRLEICHQEQLIPWLHNIQQLMSQLQHYSYTSLVEIPALSEIPRGTPLFESILVFENYPIDNSLLNESSSLQITEIEGFERTNYPLTLITVPGDELLVKISYDTLRFEEETVKRMLRHLQSIFSAIGENPQQKLGEIPLLSVAERHQLLVEWNDTAADYPADKCLHQLIEAQVEKTPDAVAVKFADEQLTYRELNNLANQLAHYLQTLGVKPEVLVGICVERSLEMVVGLLGILKAGGAYLPLDPDYPQERLSFMLEDAQVSVLLTQQHLIESLPEHQAKLVCLDTDWYLIGEYSQDNCITNVEASNLAYVIYTSGSTGQPKGVMLSHGNLCNHMFWMQATFSLTEIDKVLQKTPFGFDASVWEFYAPLLVGGQLVLAQPGGHADSSYLLKLIAQQKVTTVQFVPSLLRILLEQGGIETCDSLKQVFCGGEVLPVALQEGLFSKLNVNLHNLYGPTEACIDTTFWTCKRGSEIQVVPIGCPIANAQVYIVDEYLQPVPIGVPGELHIGGAGVARGYLNRPELTAQKFIDNPFNHQPGNRLYKTGDLARYLPDGNIQFLGRIDHQVKLRGFRIELGEIETLLRRHPTIQDTAVIVKENTNNEPQLVAYIVLRQQPAPTNVELRRFLKEYLPEYMVPAIYVALDSLPLTPNGKVDRRNLPAPDKTKSQLEEVVVAPSDILELELVQIWEDILNIRPIGVTDNFFDLGGHSLLTVRLIAQIKKRLGCELPLSELFQNPTIEDLANILKKQTNSLPKSPLVGIQTAGEKRPFFCVHPVGGNVLCYFDLARYLGTDQPFYGLQALETGEQQIERMASGYIQEIRCIQPEGPYLLGGWSMGGIVAFEMAQQLQQQGQQVELLVLFDSYATAANNKQTAEDNGAILASFALDIGLSWENRNFAVDEFLQLPLDEQVAFIYEQAKQENLISADVELSEFRHQFDIFQANLRAVWNYMPQTYPGKVILLQASDRLLETTQDATMGWGELAQDGVQIQAIPGNHYTIVRKPHVQVLAEKLSTYLN